MDIDNNLEDYMIQLEQVELALRSDPNNDELLKLKVDLEEVINLTRDLQKEEQSLNKNKVSKLANDLSSSWKSGDKCMAVWRVDGRHYPATIDQVLEDGSCTIIFDGYKTTELTQINALLPHDKNATSIQNDSLGAGKQLANPKKTYTRKELELKIREAKKRKKEKYAQKLKAIEDMREKEKNKWKSFNQKLQSKTWKGVVTKNKYDLPADHENKVGVGTNNANNRQLSASGSIINSSSASSSSSAAASAKYSKSFKSSFNN